MLTDLIWLGGGLALIIQGGDWFVAASVRAAELLKMPRVVIGSTLVSLATTSPELVVSITAGMRGESGLAVGNAIGSCICNIGLILGVTAAIKHVDVHPPHLRLPLIAMTGLGVLLFLMTLDLQLSRTQGVLLLILGAGYFVVDFTRAYRQRTPAAVAEAKAIEEDLTAGPRWLDSRIGTVLQFTGGALIVVIGSRLLVDGAVNIAYNLGVQPIIVGLTVVAVGTSLPELVTAVTSSRKSVSDLAVGNVLGANIANLSLIVGTAAVINNVPLDRGTQLYNFPALLGFIGLLFIFLRSENRLTRKEGGWLLGSYALYLGGLVALTLVL